MSDALARNGVWTPWAQVLCLECDHTALRQGVRAQTYAQHFASLSKMDRTAEVPRPEGDRLATCDACRCPCWVRDDVALLQSVGYKSSDMDWTGPFSWSLQQTGGMCAALRFECDNRQIVVTAMDGCFLVGAYAATDEGWEEPLGHRWESPPFSHDGDDKSDDDLDAMATECARQVLAIVRAKGTTT